MSNNKNALPDNFDELVAKLERHLDADPDFSKDEVATIRKMTETFRAWAGAGTVMKWLLLAVAGLSAAGTFFTNLKGGLKWFLG